METEKENDKKCECGQFKSYYVVWKHSSDMHFMLVVKKRLNRTM